MIREINPQHFGLTTGRLLLLAVGSLACFVLPMIIFSAWSFREIITGLLTRLVLGFWWYMQHEYSIEVNESNVRSGGRVARKWHIRYLREIDHLFGGRRLVLSEHGSLWARLFGGAIEIPEGIRDYETIKTKIFAWGR
jgi:hypothetical protein